MGCTGKTWVEGVNYLQNFKWFIHNFYMCINHSIFVCAMFICCSLRTCVPCGWDDTLVICRATIFNMDPVTQATSRRIYKTNTFCVFIPCFWLKFSHIRYCSITIFNVRYKFIEVILTDVRRNLCIKTTTSCTTNHSCHPYMSRYPKYLRYCIDLTNNHRLSPSWIFNNTLFNFCIYNDIFS